MGDIKIPAIFYGCTELWYYQENDEDNDVTTHPWVSNDDNMFADRVNKEIIISKKKESGQEEIARLRQADIDGYTAVYIDPSDPKKEMHLFKNGIEIGGAKRNLGSYLTACYPEKPAGETTSIDVRIAVIAELMKKIRELVPSSEADAFYREIASLSYDDQIRRARFFIADEKALGNRFAKPSEAAGETTSTIDVRIAVIAELMKKIRGLVPSSEAEAFYRKIAGLSYADQIKEARLFIFDAQLPYLTSLMAEIKKIAPSEVGAFYRANMGLSTEDEINAAKVFISAFKAGKKTAKAGTEKSPLENPEIKVLLEQLRKEGGDAKDIENKVKSGDLTGEFEISRAIQFATIDVLMVKIRKIAPDYAGAFYNSIWGLAYEDQIVKAKFFIGMVEADKKAVTTDGKKSQLEDSEIKVLFEQLRKDGGDAEAKAIEDRVKSGELKDAFKIYLEIQNVTIAVLKRKIKDLTPSEADDFINEIKELNIGEQIIRARQVIDGAESNRRKEIQKAAIEVLMKQIRDLVPPAEAESFQNKIKKLSYEGQIEQATQFIETIKSKK